MLINIPTVNDIEVGYKDQLLYGTPHPQNILAENKLCRLTV